MSSIVFGCIVPHPPLLIPEIGRGQEKAIQSTTDAMINLTDDMANTLPDTIVIVSPHGTGHSNAMGVFIGKTIIGGMQDWGVMEPVRYFNNDQGLATAIVDEAESQRIPVQTIGDNKYNLDHGVMVPMHFLYRSTEGLPLVPLTFSWLTPKEHFAFGQAIRRAAIRLNRKVALIASGDLSHRLIPGAPAGYDTMAQVFDNKLVDALSQMNVQEVLDLEPDLINRAGECGLRSIIILLGALNGAPTKPKILSYEGPFGVGYLVASFSIEELHPLVKLAKKTVETYVREGRRPELPGLTPEMSEKAGVFVSLKKEDELRGCIGTFEPTKETLAEETINNAISSATRDPRFPPVNESELSSLQYSVDVLSRPEPVSGLDELDPKRFGVIVESGGRRGLLLPDLEGVDTAEQQISICRQKAGIMPDEPVSLYRFEVKRYK